jgi:hypothetical protein
MISDATKVAFENKGFYADKYKISPVKISCFQYKYCYFVTFYKNLGQINLNRGSFVLWQTI